MRVAIVLCAFAAFIAVIAAFVVMVLNGKDTSALIMFVSGAATSVVPQIFTLLKVHSNTQDLAEVKERTNGPLTQVCQQVNEIATRMSSDEANKEGKA